MAITVNTNVSSLFAQQYLKTNQANLAQTFARLSSGKRVVEAKDDPAGLAIAQTMQAAIGGLRQGSRNGNDGISLLQTAQGDMSQTLNILQRMREIATQAASGTNGSTDLANLDTEYQALLADVSRVQAKSSFNGVSLLGGGSISIQVGENNTSNDQVSISLINTSVGSAGLNLTGTSVTSNSNAGTAMNTLLTAIDTVTTGLAGLGASQSNLEMAINSNDVRSTNLVAAKSRIMDADFAEETANLATYTILNQTNVAMLAQANSAPQLVLQLLK